MTPATQEGPAGQLNPAPKLNPAQELIYGCMGLGGSWSSEPYSSAQVDEAAAAVDAALETGITLFDHADIYRAGKSEAVFGEVLANTPGLRDHRTAGTSPPSRPVGPS